MVVYMIQLWIFDEAAQTTNLILKNIPIIMNKSVKWYFNVEIKFKLLCFFLKMCVIT